MEFFKISIICLFLFRLPFPVESQGDDDDEGTSDTPPRNNTEDDEPVSIGTTLFIQDVTSFSVQDMNFRVDLFLEHSWGVHGTYCKMYQKRLKSAGTKILSSKPIIIGKTNIKKYWSPDTYFSTAQKVLMPSKLTRAKVLRMAVEGDDKCSMESFSRLAVIVGCFMDIRNYPADIQDCPVVLRSYSYGIDLVDYYWEEPPIIQAGGISLPQHDLKIETFRRVENVMGENMTVLIARFRFIRKMSHHLIEVYAPTTITVIVSWFSFYLGLDAIPGRANLIVTCLLSLITEMSGIKKNLPPVSYINGIDIWMVVSLAFVFASLLEFTVVKYLNRKRRIKIQQNQMAMTWSFYAHPDYPFVKTIDIPELPIVQETSFFQALGFKKGGSKVSPILVPLEKKSWGGTRTKYNPNRLFDVNPPTDWPAIIDWYSRMLFPLAFLLFNLIYWPLLLGNVY